MTPKQKAKKLVDIYTKTIWDSGNTVQNKMIKECALIAVDEIMNTGLLGDTNLYVKPKTSWHYWMEVKVEIRKL